MGSALYLGRWSDGGGTSAAEDARIPADRLTTHAVVIGMTGSGKTGLLVALLEELALAGIPALVIDPKGDLTNRLLVFPNPTQKDFAPYCQAGKEAEVCERWSGGMVEWGLTPDTASALKRVPVRIFTPGSSVSPINVMENFAPPGGTSQELAASAATGAAGSLLALAGSDADASSDPPGLLLTHLLLTAWGAGRALTLEELVRQVLNPPVQKLGVLDLDTVIPPKDRTALAMRLNGLLASPSLAAWRQGPDLELDSFLAPGAGQTIFTLAHLPDEERMFFLGLLTSQLAAWTRRQRGSESLRAAIVFDEVFGYFPPYPANPPTKGPILTLLKQARAFGVGMILASQNPVDLDYKGLTNAGLWMLGRLQTEQDRRRVADALGSLPGGAGAGGMLSDLPKRCFVIHDVKESAPRFLETRQCISYLAGPLTAPQLKDLLPPSGGSVTDVPAGATSAQGAAATSAPPVPAGWSVCFAGGGELSPHLEVEVEIPYKMSPKAPAILDRVRLCWQLLGSTMEESLASDPQEPRAAEYSQEPPGGARFLPPPDYFDGLTPQKAGKAVAASVALRRKLDLLRDPLTGLVQEFKEPEQLFRERVARAREGRLKAEVEKRLGSLRNKVAKAAEKVKKLELELQQERDDASARSTETWISAGLGVLGGLTGSKRSLGGALSRTVSKQRAAARAKGEVEQAQADLDAARREHSELSAQLAEQERSIAGASIGTGIETVTLAPSKAGISVLGCRLLFAPAAGKGE